MAAACGLVVTCHFPGVGPEAQVDGPPVGGQAAAQNFRDQQIKIQHPLAKGSVGAGLIVVQRAVRINQVDVADFSAQAGEKLQRPARQRLLTARLPGSHRGNHVGMTGIIENLKIRMSDVIGHAQNLRGFVESKARLKLPQDANAPRRRPARALREGPHHPLPGEGVCNRRFFAHIRRADRVHTNAVNAQIHGEFQVLLERRKPCGIVVLRNDGKRPQVSRETREGQPLIGHPLPQLRPPAPGIKLGGVGMGRETSQLHTVKGQFPELRDHGVKGNRVILVRAKTVSPTPHRKPDRIHVSPPRARVVA